MFTMNWGKGGLLTANTCLKLWWLDPTEREILWSVLETITLKSKQTKTTQRSKKRGENAKTLYGNNISDLPKQCSI